MRYKCYECGKQFDEYKTVWESRGEFWGVPAYEPMDVCPYCGGDFEETSIVDDEEEEDY